MAKRLQAMGSKRYERGFELTLHEDLVSAPLRWRKPRMVFVNSMSDLFHEEIPLEFIEKVFSTMVRAEQHTFQILTKRSSRLLEVSRRLPWPNNVWMGVSVENESVLQRVIELRRTPAQVKFLSCEPLLGTLRSMQLDGIDWVIVGGESGPGARPMRVEWVQQIHDRCREFNVPFFFKQWGGTNKKKTGRTLDGRTWDEMPTLKASRVPATKAA
jgi:protein gp37